MTRQDNQIHTTWLPAMENWSEVLSTETTDAVTTRAPLTVSNIILCSILFVVVILTIVGNVVVILAFAIDKKLTSNNIFNYYIINLAVTDLLVGASAMSFYTFDVLLGYWPFGEFMCGIWIFFDYGMTFASVFTLLAISVDRLWSVTWSIHYRNHNNKRKVTLAIAAVWLAVLLVWLAPCIVDRVKYSQPGICIWEPSNNKEFVVFIAIIGHHGPCIIIIACYFKVAQVMMRRARIQPGMAAGNASGGGATTVSTVNESVVAADDNTVNASNQASAETTEGRAKSKKSKAESRAERERKTFVTLTYILVTYMVCWVPFHIVFDCSAVDPGLVPNSIYIATFWLTYVNSTLNPIVYAFSNREFKEAFKRVLRCSCN